MNQQPRHVATMGEVITAAFDEAAQYALDPLEVTLLATRAVQRLVRHTYASAPARFEVPWLERTVPLPATSFP